MQVKAVATNPSVLAQKTESGAVVIDTATGDCFELNRIGAEVWERIHRGETLSEIVSQMALEHEVAPARFERDLQALLGELSRLGLIVVSAAET